MRLTRVTRCLGGRLVIIGKNLLDDGMKTLDACQPQAQARACVWLWLRRSILHEPCVVNGEKVRAMARTLIPVSRCACRMRHEVVHRKHPWLPSKLNLQVWSSTWESPLPCQVPFCAPIYLWGWVPIARRLPQDARETLERLEKAVPSTPQAESSHTDLYGDPLPVAAVGRLGTIRFRRPWGWVPAPNGLAFLPDGKTILDANEDDHHVRIWEVSTGRLLHKISTGPMHIRGFALAPDGKQFVVGAFTLWLEMSLAPVKSGPTLFPRETCSRRFLAKA